VLKLGEQISYSLEKNRYGWIQVIKGKIEINGIELSASDGAAIAQEHALNMSAGDDAELLLFDLA